MVKDIDGFVLEGTPINESLVRSLQGGSFLSGKRCIALLGGTGTGKTHLAIAIAASVVRAGARRLQPPVRSVRPLPPSTTPTSEFG